MAKKTQPKSPPRDLRPLLCSVLILVAAAVSAFYTYQANIVAVSQAELAKLVQLEAQQRANDVAIYLQERQKKLNLFSTRTAMANAVNSSGGSATSVIVESLKSAYPHATATRLFGLDRREQLASEQKPLSFIEQDMINRAERRQPVPPEAIRIDQQWQLSFIAPIAESEDAPVVGTLMVAEPAAPLFNRIASNKPELGQTRLLRQASGKPVLIYQAGEGGGGNPATADIGSGGWQVEFHPSPMLAEQTARSPWLLFGAHLLAAIVLILVVVRLLNRPAAGKARVAKVEQAAEPVAEDILDVQIASEDEDILQLEDSLLPDSPAHLAGATDMEVTTLVALPDNVFRAYDIRGKAGSEITEDFAHLLGQAFATEALSAGESSVFVGRDGRSHSPALCEALVEGIVSTGCNVSELGAVPTPLLYFATCELEASSSGVMVTASHNGADYNGFKMVLKGKSLVAEDVARVKQRMAERNLFKGRGEVREQEIVSTYIDRIFSDVALAGSVKLVVDAGNGITGNVAPLLLEELGCEVVPLYCDVDGSFPNHDPDPTIPENLAALIAAVAENQADLGIALDGDGDRLVVVTPKGQIIWPDRLLMLFARDIVSGNPGADVIFDVKSTRELNALVSSYGGRPIMWKAGHSNMKTKMQETGALVGGEMSGHIFIKDRWYGFDDGMYAAARLLEIMTLRDQDIDSLFDAFPTPPSTPEIKIETSEEQKFVIIARMQKQAKFEGGSINTLDGLRVEFESGWGLVRASNTSPALTLRFEAVSEEALRQIQDLFKQELLKADDTLSIPF